MKMKNIILTKTIAAFLIVAAFVFTATAQSKSPTLGKYTGIQTGTTANYGEPAGFDLTIEKGGVYEQNGERGKFTYEAATEKIEFTSGAMPKQWVGFFIPKGTDDAEYDTIVIRDKKDVAEGNKRDLFWFNLK